MKFKPATHMFKLNFMGATKCSNIVANEIPTNHFDFVAFSYILSATNGDKLLGIYIMLYYFIFTFTFIHEFKMSNFIIHLAQIICNFFLKFNRCNCTFYGKGQHQTNSKELKKLQADLHCSWGFRVRFNNSLSYN